MNKHFYKFLALPLAMLLTLAGCSDNKGNFHVDGTIEGAADKTLYLEALTLGSGIQVLDSAKLGADGSFHFAASDTTACPELYRLRIENQLINFSIDSTETVTFRAQWPDIAFNYSVEGSGPSDTIRLLSMQLAQLERDLRAMSDNRDFTLMERDSIIRRMVRDYKDDVKIQYIQGNYDRPYSYFAIFQSINGILLWDLENDQSDVRWASAIANAWNELWPGCLRTQNLYNIVVRGRRNTHPRTTGVQLDESKIHETGIIDMTFPDINGVDRRLSDLKGKVVMLDFTAYSGQTSQERIMEMRQLYQKYHQRGLEIYQVSVDESVHFWKTACHDLPWICVYCAEGLYSDILRIYNVQMLPCYFLIDRNNVLVSRSEFIDNIEKSIEELL